VMRMLWQRYGRDFYSGSENGRGVTDAEVEVLFDEVTGLKLKRLLGQLVHGTGDLPLAKVLAPFGVTLEDKSKDAKPSLNVRTTRDGNDCKLASVYESGAAHRAGLSAGDVLVALEGLRVTATNLESLLARYRVGESVKLHAFRRDELMTFVVKLAANDAPQMMLVAQQKPTALTNMRKSWLEVSYA
jgi:predicted metalloprotease with PDZ domain